MPKPNKLEDQLAELNVLRALPITADVMAQLRKALANKNNHVVAAAAKIAAEAELLDLEPDLVKAFATFMRNPAKSDPGCKAKVAIADALTHLESAAEDVFLQGVRYIQLEPTWGGEMDTAAPLRGACALGLVGMRHRHALLELARLLADPESDARIATARALAYAGDPASVPLLRFKAHIGDEHPQVLSECLSALLKLDAETSLPFVAEFLEDKYFATAEAAALALGESRLEGAFAVLRDAWENTFDAKLRYTLLLAMAMLRTEDAIAYLLDIIRYEARAHADDAIEALRMYKHEASIWQRVQEALNTREE
ncbi:MAG TPA: HEAT repeat domain-containing protein [bacterium]|nr:HEAT repeat domain-containing protein [bacterium]